MFESHFFPESYIMEVQAFNYLKYQKEYIITLYKNKNRALVCRTYVCYNNIGATNNGRRLAPFEEYKPCSHRNPYGNKREEAMRMNVTLTDLIQILIANTAIAALFYQIGKKK